MAEKESKLMEEENKPKSTTDLLEDPDALAQQINKTEEYIKKNKNLLIGVVVAIAALVAGGYFYLDNIAVAEQEAQLEIYPLQYYFNLDSMNVVLNGNADVISAPEIAEQYSGTKVGNLANYYAGVASLKTGQFEDAISYLNKFTADDWLIQARAYALIGDANLELSNTEAAIQAYEKAANTKPNMQYSPGYLLKLAVAYETAGDYASATKTYDKIIKGYPRAYTVLADVKKYKARASELASSK